MAPLDTARPQGAIVEADPLPKFFGEVCGDAPPAPFTTFVNGLEGKTIEQLLDLAKAQHAEMLQSLRRSALAAWKLGAVLSRLKPHYKRDWIKWHRSIGLNSGSVNRYMRLYQKIKDPKRLDKMLISEAERIFGIKTKAKKKQSPLPNPSALPEAAQAREKISEGLELLLKVNAADTEVLQQAKELAQKVLDRIAQLEAASKDAK